MALPKLRNRAWMTTATTGTGTITLGSAVSGYQTFGDAGVNNAEVIRYTIVDGTGWEVGTGTYTSSGTTLTRTVIESSNSDSALNLSGTATVFIADASADFARGMAPGLYNATLVESHAASAATFAIKTIAGNDPSTLDPVVAVFGDGSAYLITAATSITINSTATMGATNGTAFRIWLSLVDDSATLRIGVRNCSSASGIFPFPATGLDTTTTIGTSADNAGVTYTGTGATAKRYIIIGFADYESGLSTAGTWDASPTRITLFGAGLPKPDEEVQHRYFTTTSATTTTSSTYQNTTLTDSISPTSPINPIRTIMNGIAVNNNTALTNAVIRLHRGATAIGILAISGVPYMPVAVLGIDFPYTTSSTTYTAKLKSTDNTTTVGFPEVSNGVEAHLELIELMG